MRRLAIVAVAAMLLTACVTTPSDPAPGQPPGPPAGSIEDCSSTAPIEQRTLCLAFEGFDLALSGVDVLRDLGVLRPGSATALAVQRGIREVQAALNDASAIQRGIRTGDYGSALTRAQAALQRLQAAIRGVRQPSD